MADKLDWLNRHLTLIRYLTVEDVIGKEGYKIRPDLAEHFEGVKGVEEMVFKFVRLGDHKSACELLAYIAHRRAAVWWVYRCVLSLLEELKENPAVDRDIADIAASFDVTVPDFAKVELPQPPPEVEEQMQAAFAASKEKLAEARAKVDPEMLKYVEDAVEVAFQEFKRVHGIHPKDLLKKLAERCKEDPYKIDPNSPLYVEAAKVKAQIQAGRKEAVETIKAVVPPKAPEHEKKVRDNALDAVYRWVVVPDNESSQKCLDLGNECPDTPAGLLSLSGFWAYGNLMPMGDQVIATPPGLAANGLVQTLLMCALHKGGTRKVKERYEEYFRLGVEVFTGADNWEKSLAAGVPPHRETRYGGQLAAGNGQTGEPGGYRRWNAGPGPASKNGVR
ncbi:MAG: hypothetical protein LBR93_01225 [Treponema sp.]|jgi:hypothetical protein|nr:hypothetical protein [Treponema sp.]